MDHGTEIGQVKEHPTIHFFFIPIHRPTQQIKWLRKYEFDLEHAWEFWYNLT